MTSGQNLRPDMNNAEYILFAGAYPGHSGKPMQSIGRQIKSRMKNRDIKFVVVDPVMVGGAISPLHEEGEWIPIKPTTDNAFGMGLIRWIIENDRHNKEYLSSPNFESALNKGYNSYTNSTHLVIKDEDHPNNNKLLRAEDVGIEIEDEEENIYIVVDKTGEIVRFDEIDEAELLYDDVIKTKDGEEIKVKTSFTLLEESANTHELEDYSDYCGVPLDKIEQIGKDFTSHGTKVATDGMGNTATANGSDTARINYALLTLVGSINKKGGTTTRRNSYKSIAPGPRYKTNEIVGKPDIKGMVISRTGIKYEDTTEYKEKVARGEDPYPSTLPWHPVGGASDNQALFSIINGYPYKAKIIMNWMANPLLAVPGGAREEVREALKKTENVPLFISCDIYMGEMTALADYIIPDTTPYESWGIANVEGNYAGKGNTVRWPVVEPATEKLADGRHLSFETYVIDVAKKIGLPGFGDEAIPDMDGNLLALNTREDYFVRGIANMAYDEDIVDDISQEEIDMQDLDKIASDWSDIVNKEEWPKVLNIISRGGRFEEYGEGFDGDNHKYGFETPINIYIEEFGTGRNSTTGEFYNGVPAWNKEAFSDGSLLSDVYPESEWPFKAANYKPKFRSISMLDNSPKMRDLGPQNYVEINSEDAKNLGISSMDEVKVTPATGGEFTGNALVRPGIAQGTIGVEYGYGHWEYGAKDYTVDGESQADTEGKGKGFHLMNLLDPTVDKVFGISESSTGGPGRNGGAYKIEKI